MLKQNLLMGLISLTLMGCGSDNQSDDTIIKEPTSKTKKAENASFRYINDCIGCKDVTLLDGLLFSGNPLNDSKLIEMSVAPNSTGNMFFQSRVENLSKKIAIGSCEILDKNLNKNIDEKILDAGDIKVYANWSGWETAIFKYHNSTKNYSTQLLYRGDGVNNYTSNSKITFTGEGGKDISSFEVSDTTMTPLILTNPKVDRNGKVPQIDKSIPLKVTWQGGDSQDIIIYLTSKWVTTDSNSEVLACHVKNDGNFLIPLSILKKYNWGQLTTLTLLDFKKKTMHLSSNKNAQLVVSSSAFLYIHQDINATLPMEDITMQIGFVGKSCTTDTECGGGTCFLEDPFFGGYCGVKNCTIENNQCPSDANCYADKSQLSLPTFCAKPCNIDSDCRVSDAQVCRVGDDNKKSCVPGVN